MKHGDKCSLGLSEPKLLVWSAADEGGLARLSEIYSRYFEDVLQKPTGERPDLQDLAYTLACRRSSLAWKAFTIAASLDDLQDLKRSMSSPKRSSKTLGMAFVFSGQGTQHSQMGTFLMSFPIFANTLKLADSTFQRLGCQWSLFGKNPFLRIPVEILHMQIAKGSNFS